ncbi:hypothetical protein [Leptolyngbya sp. FACHB-17]|nr:hypothetical protein [Leptolyngbya sp. FACHB-17]MBD2083023.1 hypothetical protein [Leptolyngbya sp. FACHB-17]
MVQSPNASTHSLALIWNEEDPDRTRQIFSARGALISHNEFCLPSMV